MTSALILLPFLSVAQQELGTRKAIFWSMTINSKNLSSQCNLTAQIEPVQDKIDDEYIFCFFRYLQFYIRVGSNSITSTCPPPDRPSETVILDYSCDAGITWNYLKRFSDADYRSPKSVYLFFYTVKPV